MSSDYIYATGVITPEKKSAGRIEKGLKKLLIIAAIIFIAQIIWLFGVSPFIPFTTIQVHGIDGINRGEILHLAGINETSSFISTNTGLVRERLSAHLLVESSVVIKRFPDKLSIFIVQREPVAMALTAVNSRLVPVFVDRNGVFFRMGTSADNYDLPIISGIENLRLNMRLPAALVSLTENIRQISVSSPELLSAISEIRIERKVWDGYELVLFPVHSSIRVRVENNLTEDTLRYMLLMLNVFESTSQRPQEIDFRSGMGSYRIGG
jgi:cell division protein FtsQ